MKTLQKYSSGQTNNSQILCRIHHDKQKEPILFSQGNGGNTRFCQFRFSPRWHGIPNRSPIHFRGGGEKKKKKSDATEWKNENTNLLIVTSAACSGETAGCQTLKGTGAEFNASCQESLMWLSPPARAGIVKLSGAGKDAQTALRDALSLSPLQEHRSGRNRGWETSTIFTKVCVCVCMCACVNSNVDMIFLQLITVVPADAVAANGGWGGWAPLLTLEKLVLKVKVLLTGHLRAYYFVMYYASVCEAILRYSLVCEDICVCLWVNKNHCLVRLRNISLPLFSPLRSQSLPARIDRPSADYWSMNLYKMIITICLFQ